MSEFIDLRFKSERLAQYGLPDIDYPLPENAIEKTLLGDSLLPFALMLYGLQEKASHGEAIWKDLEPAMERLTALLADEHDKRDVITIAQDDWWFESGPVDLSGELVTIQRGDDLLAAIAEREDGRLRITTFRPLDAKSLRSIINCSIAPHPDSGVCMRENNWEYIKDNSAGMGQVYAAERGESYLSYWDRGLGLQGTDDVIPIWMNQRALKPRHPSLLTTELLVHYSLSPQYGPEEGVTIDIESELPPLPWKRRPQRVRIAGDMFMGCLLGGAIGDALGAPVEFMTRRQIMEHFGSDGLCDYAPAYGGLGRITDDTQMTLFTAEAMLRVWLGTLRSGEPDFPRATARAYLRWLRTQGERPSADLVVGEYENGFLFQEKALFSRRAPGNTCLSALKSMRRFGEWPQNNSKGCGGVMRVAPVGLYSWHFLRYQPLMTAFEIGVNMAAMTHGHPTGYLTGGVLTILIMALVDGASLSEALLAAKSCLITQRGHEETLAALDLAEELSRSGLPHHDAIARLGLGWVAEEALAISIYCALVADDFERGVILAINHDGDSDSTGAITGNLIGARDGLKAIPAKWMKPLELRGVITKMANDLFNFYNWEIDENGRQKRFNRALWEEYPGP